VLFIVLLQFVSVVFWGVYSFDRELMFPAVLDSFFPTWLNHAVHTAPVIFGLFEHLFVPITYPRPLIGAGILAGGTAFYLSWYKLASYCCTSRALIMLCAQKTSIPSCIKWLYNSFKKNLEIVF